MEMGAYHYWCDFPVEENGSHWHCEYGGGAVQGIGGINIFMFNASVLLRWGCWGFVFVPLPDDALWPAEPAGAWKNALHPKKCVPVEVAPTSKPNTGLPPAGNSGVTNRNPQPSDHGKPVKQGDASATST